MSTHADEIRVLSRALDQAGDVLEYVHADQLTLPTPCAEWTVSELVDHLVAAPLRFTQMLRGEEPDWANAAHVTEPPAPVFRVLADDLLHAWHQQPEDRYAGADWQTAEIAVHTWDLATALGRSLDRLDPEVAERGLGFMKANLTAENRGPVFGAEQPVADDADPYTRIAAFAGRTAG
jgi:uncharacterized protein (TIGR03086 family)